MAESPDVALVFGSFLAGHSRKAIKTIQESFPHDLSLSIGEPVEGNAFDFNTLKTTKVLVVCSSSQLGYPPPNIQEFVYHLLVAATTNPGCLSHLRHAVFGNGSEEYWKTYMNVPRYIDRLLEQCGSRRFYARGERGEPHAALGTESCGVQKWAPAMWGALAQVMATEAEGNSDTVVPWDALWAKKESEFHQNVKEWPLEKLEGVLEAPIKNPTSIFARL